MKKETSSGGIVFRTNKNKCQVLLVKHASTSYWGFPKGLVGDFDKNESLETAALREVEEEGGIKAKIIIQQPIKTGYQYQWQGKLIDKTVFYFLMEYLSGDPKNHDWEMSEAKFVTEEEVQKTLTYPSDQQAFQAMLKLFSSWKANKTIR